MDLYVILKKMFKIGRYKWSMINFVIDDWYWHYTWTTKQEQKFMKWLVKYNRKHHHLRPEEGAGMFLLNIGS